MAQSQVETLRGGANTPGGARMIGEALDATKRTVSQMATAERDENTSDRSNPNPMNVQ